MPENPSFSQSTSIELEKQEETRSLLLDSLSVEDAFVPPHVFNRQDYDDEEVAVLESLQIVTPQGEEETLLSRSLRRTNRKVKHFTIPNTKSRKTRRNVRAQQ